MKFLLFDHGGKGTPLGRALVSQGHEASNNIENADCLLIDHEAPWGGDRLPLIEACKDRMPVFIYPHGGPPQLAYDGCQPVHPDVTALFVQAPGHKEIFGKFDYPHPVNNIGWYYCPCRPGVFKKRIRNVLFAPMHPSDWNRANTHEVNENFRIFQEFLEVPVHDKKTVRFAGPPGLNGIDTSVPGIEFVQVGDISLNWDDIDRADVVIATGTYAYLALARGKPVVMFRNGRPGQEPAIAQGEIEFVHNWDKYKHLCEYPYTAETAPLKELVHQAMWEGYFPIEEFRERMVGPELDPKEFSDLLMGLIEEWKDAH